MPSCYLSHARAIVALALARSNRSASDVLQRIDAVRNGNFSPRFKYATIDSRCKLCKQLSHLLYSVVVRKTENRLRSHLTEDLMMRVGFSRDSPHHLGSRNRSASDHFSPKWPGQIPGWSRASIRYQEADSFPLLRKDFNVQAAGHQY